MSLTNIAVNQGPTARIQATISLATIGLTTRAIKLSPTVNMTNLDPQFHEETHQHDMETWWLCVPTELHQAMVDQQTGQLRGIMGSKLMPSFNKMILSKSPTGAVTTAFYHATEGHVVTDNKEQYVLTSIMVNKNKDQQFVRLGHKTVNLFNRAYIIPQVQVECGSTWRFTTDEISSTQHWTLMSNNDQAVMAKIATTLSWSNSFLGTYNYVFPTAVVTNSESDDHCQALLHAVAYGEATCLHTPPARRTTSMESDQ